MSKYRRGEFTNIPFKPAPETIFGELAVSNLTPVVQATAVYGIEGEKMETFTATGGTATATNSEFVCSTGTSAGGYGVIRTKKSTIYHAGQGVDMRFTARFTTPVALSLQLAGAFTSNDGLFFGYDGTQFGLMHRHGGKLEHRHIQVTAAATGAETMTITLNSVAYSVDLTSGTAAHNAYEIATELTADAAASAVWTFEAIGDRVEVLAKTDGPLSGTYSYTNAGTCAVTFTTKEAGVTKTQDWTYQDDWNQNTCSWLDPTKGNVFKVRYQYLGYGEIQFFVEDEASGEFILVHSIHWQNNNQATSFTNPALKLGWVSASLGSTTNLSVYGASCAGFIEGKKVLGTLPHSAKGTNTSVGTSLVNVLSIKNRRTFKSTTNLGEMNIQSVSATSDGTKATFVELYLIPDVAGEPLYNYVDENHSIAVVDTAGGAVTNGQSLPSFVIPAGGGAETFDLRGYGISLYPEQSLVVSARVASGSSAEVSAAITWKEDI